MTALKNARTIYPGFGNAPELYRFTYDFAKDAGAQGALTIMTAGSALVLLNAWVTVKTAVTSGGSATVIWGTNGDTDKFLTTTGGAKANLTAAVSLFPPAIEGTPNVLSIPWQMVAADTLVMTIGTADLTAGVLEFAVMVMKP